MAKGNPFASWFWSQHQLEARKQLGSAVCLLMRLAELSDWHSGVFDYNQRWMAREMDVSRYTIMEDQAQLVLAGWVEKSDHARYGVRGRITRWPDFRRWYAARPTAATAEAEDANVPSSPHGVPSPSGVPSPEAEAPSSSVGVPSPTCGAVPSAPPTSGVPSPEAGAPFSTVGVPSPTCGAVPSAPTVVAVHQPVRRPVVANRRPGAEPGGGMATGVPSPVGPLVGPVVGPVVAKDPPKHEEHEEHEEHEALALAPGSGGCLATSEGKEAGVPSPVRLPEVIGLCREQLEHEPRSPHDQSACAMLAERHTSTELAWLFGEARRYRAKSLKYVKSISDRMVADRDRGGVARGPTGRADQAAQGAFGASAGDANAEESSYY